LKKTLKSYLDKRQKVRRARASKLSTVYILATGGHRRRRRVSTLEYYMLSASREQGENWGNSRFAPPRDRDQGCGAECSANSARAWRRCCFCDATGRHSRTYVFARQKLVQESRFTDFGARICVSGRLSQSPNAACLTSRAKVLNPRQNWDTNKAVAEQNYILNL